MVRRVENGVTTYEGVAVYQTIKTRAFYHPESGEKLADEQISAGWMHKDIQLRVPEPTHWRRP